MNSITNEPQTTSSNRPMPRAPRRALLGLFDRRERWSLSLRGWLTIMCSLLLTAAVLMTSLHPFLAATHRVPTDILVVEGWINAYAIRAAAEEFRKGSYRHVFTTGGPVVGSGRYINDYNTTASVGADLLKGAGIPGESLHMVPSRVMDRHRTYTSAVALRDWFGEHNMPVRSINVLTEDAHGRRTRLLFQKAFGNDVAVGIIAVPNPDYDPKYWWRYSQGVREVLSEGVAYLYARFFFYPAKSGQQIHASQAIRSNAHGN